MTPQGLIPALGLERARGAPANEEGGALGGELLDAVVVADVDAALSYNPEPYADSNDGFALLSSSPPRPRHGRCARPRVHGDRIWGRRL